VSVEESKTVLVTGGSRGLGLGIVQNLLAAGYRVGTCSRKISTPVEELLEKYDRQCFQWAPCVIGEESEEEKFFRSFLDWSGKSAYYGLVNNAGIAREGILATFPNVETARIIDVNLLASLRFARLSVQVFLGRRGPARIINISSIIGLRGYTGLSAYSVSKAGLDGLTRALAREIGRRDVTVNSVNPGYLETDMSSSLGGQQREQIIRRTPMGRLGKVDDVVPLVRFLLSREAGFITGQCIVVDGGITT
jgi:3-oxoacyl-[acyl-carrier protein] reductase